MFPVKNRSVDFLGYKIWPTHRLLRKTSVVKMKRKLKSFTNKKADKSKCAKLAWSRETRKQL